MKLEDYTIELLKSISLTVDEDGIIYNSNGSKILIDKDELRLATKENINNQNTVTNNVLVKNYTLFNPYSEDDMRANKQLVLLARYMTVVSTMSLYGVMRGLIDLLEDEAKQAKVSTHIQKWMMDLRVKVGNRVKLVTSKTIKELDKFIEQQTTNGKALIQYRTAKGDTVNGIKYNRLAKIDPIGYDTLTSEEFDIADKENKVFQSMIDFILPDLNTMSVGSKSNRFPSIISLVDLFREVHTRLNFLADELKDLVDDGVYELIHVDLPSDINIESMSKEIDFLPTGESVKKNNSNDVLNKLKNSISTVGFSSTPVEQNSNIGFNSNNNIPQDDDILSSFSRKVIGHTDRSGFLGNPNTQILNQQHNMNPLQNALQNANMVNNGFNQQGFGSQQGFNRNQGFSNGGFNSSQGFGSNLNQGFSGGFNSRPSINL